MSDATIDLLQALGEQVEAQGKHITRLDDLTKVQAQLIEHMDAELEEMDLILRAQALGIYGANRYLIKSIDDIAFLLPNEARQTLRQAHAQANQGLGIVPRDVRQG